MSYHLSLPDNCRDADFFISTRIEDSFSFSDFLKALNENSFNAEKSGVSYTALEIPPDAENRLLWCASLIALFEKQLQHDGILDKKVLGAVRQSIVLLLPDPMSQDFDLVIKDRVFGIIAIMKMLLDLCRQGAPVELIESEAALLSDDLKGNKLVENVFANLPLNLYKQALQPKIQRLKDVIGAKAIAEENEKLRHEICSRFKEYKKYIDEIFTAYRSKVNKFVAVLPRHEEVKLENYFLNSFMEFDPKRTDTEIILSKLKFGLESAESPAALFKAIEEFGENKLLDITLTGGPNMTRADTLPELFEEMMSSERVLGVKNSQRYPVRLSNGGNEQEGTDADFVSGRRKEIKAKIINLFNASIEDPYWREFARGEIDAFLDVENADFAERILDRKAGILELLRLTYNNSVQRGGVAVALIEFRGMIRSVVGLPFRAERGKVCARNVLVDRVEQLKIGDFSRRNGRLVEDIRSRLNGSGHLIGAVRDSFIGAIEDLRISPYKKEQWLYVLMSKLATVENFEGIEGLPDALEELMVVLNGATQEDQISDAIDHFVQKVLPELSRRMQEYRPVVVLDGAVSGEAVTIS